MSLQSSADLQCSSRLAEHPPVTRFPVSAQGKRPRSRSERPTSLPVSLVALNIRERHSLEREENPTKDGEVRAAVTDTLGGQNGRPHRDRVPRSSATWVVDLTTTSAQGDRCRS